MPCHDKRAPQTWMVRSAMQPSGAPVARRADTSGAYQWKLAALARTDKKI